MSAPIDSASQGGAAGVRSVAGASPEVNLQANLTSTADGSPPASAVTAVAAAASSSASKRTAEPVTTARSAKKAKKSAADKISKGRRVSCRKQTLWHIVKSSTEEGKAQQAKIKGFAPGYRLYGTVKSGSGKKGYVAAFDVFPAEAREVVVLRRQLKLLPIGADEPDFEYKADSSDDDDDTDDDTPQKKKKKKLSPEQQSIQDFTGLKKDVLAKATEFNFAFGKGDDEKIEWSILPDGQHVTDLPFEPPTEAEYHKDIPWETKDDKDYNKVFFEHFFPSIKGHAKIIDKYLEDPRAKYHRTVVNGTV